MQLPMQPAIDELSNNSSRDLVNYSNHISARIRTSTNFVLIMKLKSNRRWKFDSYQQGQRAVHQLAAAVLDGVEKKSDVIVAWGNGAFGPSYKGHAPAPNKSLRRSLSRFFPIVMVNENNTTKKTNCCGVYGKGLRTAAYRKTRRRATVVQCPECKTILSRDTNAAKNILHVFRYQTKHKTSNVPEYLRL